MSSRGFQLNTNIGQVLSNRLYHIRVIQITTTRTLKLDVEANAVFTTRIPSFIKEGFCLFGIIRVWGQVRVAVRVVHHAGSAGAFRPQKRLADSRNVNRVLERNTDIRVLNGFPTGFFAELFAELEADIDTACPLNCLNSSDT
jgi:hypothetical protein